MVAVRTAHVGDNFDLTAWETELDLPADEVKQIDEVFIYCEKKIIESKAEGIKLTKRAAEMVNILITLHMDIDTFKAAVLYPHLEEHFFTLEQAKEDYGENIAHLLHGVKDMEAISFMHNLSCGMHISETQVDTVRRMLIAMIEDVRAVVIKLAERISVLREVKNADEETKVLVAKEISSIYAPLANRLGIGQLKWELEDLSFRYLHPEEYKRIADLLEDKRRDRVKYINDFVESLSAKLKLAGIKAEVTGRPKHIYSIWRKMQKKRLEFSELYDVSAVRIIVEHLQDCYAALGVVHTQYHHIPREFDDYIANPKPNGYQSIHTVVVGPGGKNVEIQIRTQTMHKNAELGVAAHWKYKEGPTPGVDAEYEERISWLRKLLSWQEDMVESGTIVAEFKNQVFEDRVYVFTPNGEVVDLPAGSTPLDFAYQIHTGIGHRCVGAKVGGHIVPFTYKLQTGDQVEIITQKEENPSRDWMNPNNDFLFTSKARSKVSSWFKKVDRDKNIVAGREMLDKDIERHGLTIPRDRLLDLTEELIKKNNAKTLDDLLARIGSGDIHINQVINFLEEKNKDIENSKATNTDIINALKSGSMNKISSKKSSSGDQIVVNGVGNLLTHIAHCCNPIPGDYIMGFITQGNGISIHRADCVKVKHLAEVSPERIVEAKWGENYSQGYSVTVGIEANDRAGLLRDITTIIANQRINVLGVSSRSDTYAQTAKIEINMEVYNINDLSTMLTRLGQLPGIISAKRL